LPSEEDERVHAALIKAFYFLEKTPEESEDINIQEIKKEDRKPALIGLLHKENEEVDKVVENELNLMAVGDVNDKLLVIDIVSETTKNNFTSLLKTLLLDKNEKVFSKAIEAAGKVRDFNLFSEVVEVAAKHRAYPALQRAMLFYGDEIFAEEYLKAESVPAPLSNHVIKAAGRIKGEHSTAFLFKLLPIQPRHADLVIEALWLKKSKINSEHSKIIEDWVQKKIEQSRIKVLCYNSLVNKNELSLLQQAIKQEIRYDLQVLLKAFSLMYDRQRVDRVLELFWLNNKSRIFNAIEVLELVVPGKYFNPLNNLVELLNDIGKNEVLVLSSAELADVEIIEAVLKNRKANFNEWTRSVACYMLPKITMSKDLYNLLNGEVSKEDHLYNETKHYVLSILK
jgi:hypothetical protein